MLVTSSKFIYFCTMTPPTQITVLHYIKQFPEHVQVLLNEIRTTILHVAPSATESMSYGMPAYKLHNKPLIYFAGYKHHIGLYATPSGHKAFAKELGAYKQGKGSVQFPLTAPLPIQLIEKIVAFKAAENMK